MTHDLPDLMRRATEDLQPDTTALVARGIRRGRVLRRRRTVLAGLSGVTAVLATVGILIGANQAVNTGVPPATTPTVKPSQAAVAGPVTPAQTLATLTGLLPAGLTPASSTTSGGYGLGTNEATVLLDDGAGASLLTLSITTAQAITDCNPFPPSSCTIKPDHSVHVRYNSSAGALRQTTVELFYPNGTQISLSNYNAKSEKSRPTRPAPLLTATQLAKIAASKRWAFPPPQAPDFQPPPDPNDPAAGHPPVPVKQTLATLKNVLPDVKLSRPKTWTGGFNAASYVVDGTSIITVLVQIDVPKTACGEGYADCTVRTDHAVVSWTKEEKEIARRGGASCNKVEIAYPDGRRISMDSCNAVQTEDAAPARAKPAFTTDQLLTFAGNAAWKFPGS
ncbi:hypothetical protein [Kribbella sp. NPDC004536]|uniref:hypothetical protein n=1 Tax=Kribbella sp. NPDC004536 TaxID=3364106 RepID=UPI0036CFA086